MIGLIDYGAGNLHSINRALKYLGYKTHLISSPNDLNRVEKLIIPGVGSFGPAIRELKKKNLVSLIKHWINHSRPLLGICLGLQLLTEGSEESPANQGFCHFSGKCQRLKAKKVPHIGWNEVKIIRADPIFSGLIEPIYFYFIHSYAFVDHSSSTIAVTEYEYTFSSVLRKGSVYACQFHPEKSGETGLLFLKNWVEQC
ncbi:MAG: imidazole glycerol phosphate synthase subunit HisH [Candidatus Saccharicenans sp.]